MSEEEFVNHDLDDLFKDDEAPQAESTGEEPEKEPEPEPEVVAEEPEGETPAPEDKEDESQGDTSWTKAAALDERRKRQKAEDERDRLAREIEALRKPVEEPKRPDIFEDQEAAFAHLESEVDKKRINDKIELSQDIMLRTVDDYQEMENVFVEMVTERPELAVKMRAHPNPAGFVYDTAKNKAEYDAMQDVGTYKAKLREEVEAELRKEYDEKLAKEVGKQGANVPSLSTVSSTSSDNGSPGQSLEEIMGD